MKKQKPYNNSVSDFFLFVISIALVLALSSCATGPKMKRDCEGNKHYKHKNGFYI